MFIGLLNTHFNPLAIYLEDTMVGFAIYIVIDNGIGEIEAIMIDQHYQGRGYGRSAMIELINLLKNEYQCKEVRLSHRKKNDTASKLSLRWTDPFYFLAWDYWLKRWLLYSNGYHSIINN
ncbi:GNAT family N-acetyltransferase [Paenibacillus sp. H1-7]|nr:GNAT family N-acetyltransferase [Paenibacillus sp. H1-7]